LTRRRRKMRAEISKAQKCLEFNRERIFCISDILHPIYCNVVDQNDDVVLEIISNGERIQILWYTFEKISCHIIPEFNFQGIYLRNNVKMSGFSTEVFCVQDGDSLGRKIYGTEIEGNEILILTFWEDRHKAHKIMEVKTDGGCIKTICYRGLTEVERVSYNKGKTMFQIF
jgi:hypothetical protein